MGNDGFFKGIFLTLKKGRKKSDGDANDGGRRCVRPFSNCQREQ